MTAALRAADPDRDVHERRYWVVVASRDHVRAAVAGGFMQANHGQAGPLRRTRPGDVVVFYSPTLTYRGPGMQGVTGDRRGAAPSDTPPHEPGRTAAENRCQAFTALGAVADAPVVQADMGGGFTPWRRAVAFHDVTSAPIAPLLGELSFIRDPRRWGAPFRFGLFEIPPADYARIARALGAVPADSHAGEAHLVQARHDG